MTVTLHNCRIHMRNNSRTLDTRYFNTPIEQVVVHQRRKDVQLEIALRQPAKPTPREEQGRDGNKTARRGHDVEPRQHAAQRMAERAGLDVSHVSGAAIHASRPDGTMGDLRGLAHPR